MIFKQFGVGLAAAILIDATIIRAVLLPASMRLLGDWNWYLPEWLEWLPHLEHGRLTRTLDAPPRARAQPPRRAGRPLVAAQPARTGATESTSIPNGGTP